MDFATPAVFKRAKIEIDEEQDPKRGQRLEIKIYEARYNSKDVRVKLSAGMDRTVDTWEPSETDAESALTVTRYYDRQKELEYTEMEVGSPHIRKALRTVVKTYPGLTFDTGKVVIRDEPRCIFHYRSELQHYGMTLTDASAAQHLMLFLNYMYNSLTREMTIFYTYMESETAAPGIEYTLLWMAFVPGSLVVHSHNEIHRVYRLKSMARGWRSWVLTCTKIVYDGDDFGFDTVTLSIPLYEGYKPLTELRVYPLRYHPSESELRAALVARGHKYVGMRKVSHRYHSGVANSLSPYRHSTIDGEEDYYTKQSITIKGRIIVDCAKFGTDRPAHKTEIARTDIIQTDETGVPIIEDEEWCMFDSQIEGYSLSAKRWCHFELDNIKEFEYNRQAYEFLELDRMQKSMLVSLVKAHLDGLDFDDLVRGKGKGMIFLLHGEPGTGKTLTAESLSDFTERPLFTVSSGDLGTTATECEKALVEILDLVTHWKAVLLIDEADIFLEKRSSHDLTRNGVVAVFLRLLEYFEGIIFLTTNRIRHFDTAFKSRIHLAIRYPALSHLSQRQLWATFTTNNFQRPSPEWLDDVTLDNLAAEMLDGRQIRNVVRAAMALAAAEERGMQREDIFTGLRVIKEFDKDFTGHTRRSYGTSSHRSGSERNESGEDSDNGLNNGRAVSGKGPKRRRML